MKKLKTRKESRTMRIQGKEYKCVIWDWNGTLFDDVGASLRAVNGMMQSRGLPDLSLDTYREYMDVPIERFYLRAFLTDTLDMDAVSPEYGALYARFASELMFSETARGLLQTLRAAGLCQVILSGANTGIIQHYLDKFRIEEYFDAVSGSDDLLVGEKMERLKSLLQRLGLQGRECLLIGDTLHDSETAEAAGADCVLLESGHQAGAALRETGWPVLADMDALHSYLREVFF